jgi:hypothetical protein
MIYLKKFESYDDQVNGYVLNGIFFLSGFNEVMFSKPSLVEIEKIFDELNNKYDFLAPLTGCWLHGPFAAKYNVWIPGYIFQVPCRSLEDAKESANEIVNKLKVIYNKPICIAISEGTIKANQNDPLMSDGTAYHKSGRYIDNPNNCMNMIKSDESIRMV